MRTFVLVRDKDVSGVSGTGIVAEGVEFDDGRVAMVWLSPFSTMESSPDIDTIVKLHGHDGSTRVEWIVALKSPSREDANRARLIKIVHDLMVDGYHYPNPILRSLMDVLEIGPDWQEDGE